MDSGDGSLMTFGDVIRVRDVTETGMVTPWFGAWARSSALTRWAEWSTCSTETLTTPALSPVAASTSWRTASRTRAATAETGDGQLTARATSKRARPVVRSTMAAHRG